MSAPSVFISYSRRDAEFVRQLHASLSDAGFDVWVDWEDIPPSAPWSDEIRSGVGSADGFVYVISPESVASAVCGRELSYAVEQNKRIVPVVHREPNGSVPDPAAALNWVFLRADDDYGRGLDELVRALQTDLEHVRTHTRLGVEAQRWHDAGRDKNQLLRGADLAAAESWLVSGPNKQPAPTQLQRAFVLASRQMATRRQRTVIGGVGFGLVVAVALAVVALVQRSSAIHERNVARAGQLDAEAQNRYATDPASSVRLALQAEGVAPSASTDAALRQAMAKSPLRLRVPLGQAGSGDAVWSPDGTRLLVTSPGRWARIYAPFTGGHPLELAGAPASDGQSAWDARGDRVALAGGHTAVFDAHTGARLRALPAITLSVALSPDGSRAITAGIDGTGRVFDVTDGRVTAVFRPKFRAGEVCFALSPSGRVAAQCDARSSSPDSVAALDLWDTRTGRLIRSIPSSSLISDVSFSPDGKRVAFANDGRLAPGGTGASAAAQARFEGSPGTFVYNTAGHGPPVITFPGAATAVAFSPSGQVPELAYATLTGPAVHVWNFDSRTEFELTGHTDTVESLAFSAGGAFIVSSSRDDTARVYNAGGGGPAVEVLSGDTDRITSASFGLRDEALATTSDDGTTRVWASPIPRPARTAPTPGTLEATVTFNAAGNLILDASEEGRGEVLDARNLHVVSRFDAPSGGFSGAVLSRNGRFVYAVSGPYDAHHFTTTPTTADVYSARTGRLVASMPRKPGGAILAAVDARGERMVTLGGDGAGTVWNPQTGAALRRLVSSGIPGGLAFSHDGSRLAILRYPTLPRAVGLTTQLGPVRIELWSPQTGRRERVITGPALMSQTPGTKEYAPLSAAFSPDGKLLAVAGAEPEVDIYRTDTGRLAKTLSMRGSSVGSFADEVLFSPDGKLLAAGAAAGVDVWSLPSYAGISYQQAPAGTASFVGGALGVRIGFSADSRVLSASGADRVKAWDLASRLEVFASTQQPGTLNPGATAIVAANGRGLALYPCELCASRPRLLQTARARVAQTG